MFLLDTGEIIVTTFASILIACVLIAFIFVVFKLFKDNLKPSNKSIKNKNKLTLEDKIYKRDLFFSYLGGVENIIKIEYKEEYLLVYLKNIKLIKEDLLKDYGVIDLKMNADNNLELTFLDNQKEYDDLFGK